MSSYKRKINSGIFTKMLHHAAMIDYTGNLDES